MQTTVTTSSRNSREAFERLKSLLREMFQLDRGDLDYGLYRVIKNKASMIGEYLDRDLPSQVQKAIEGVTDEKRKQVELELEQTIKQIKELKAEVEGNERIAELRNSLANMREDKEAEAEVYNHLAIFFGRYYHEGDFMSLRRYSTAGHSTYLIPYDGEEIKLHWANSDQYYIKTTENYTSYAFSIDNCESVFRVRFEVTVAENEKDYTEQAKDNKRRFVLAKSQNNILLDGNDIVVRFEHRPLTDDEKNHWKGKGGRQQEQIDKESEALVLEALERLVPDRIPHLIALSPTEANPKRTLLSKHIQRYSSKNNTDYFIHKDLGGFLHRELNLYLKTEVLNVDDLSIEDNDRFSRTLARMHAVRFVGRKVIDFLAQYENFQKRLWLKKKFVLDTQWCVTLDRIPFSLYSEIAENDNQREEWMELFAIDEVVGDLANGGIGYSEPLSVAFLQTNPYLIVDTRHFDLKFKDKLLTAISDAGPLDEQTDGLVIHGENFQALSLLQERYAGQVQCIYIDPPYNTKSSEILYKNSYRNSTWLSFIENRITKSRIFEADRAVVVVAIDEVEQEYLGCLLNSVYSDRTKTCVTVIHNPNGQQGNNFSTTHEYAYFLYSLDGRSIGMQERREKPDIRPLRDVSKGEHLRGNAANCFYPIFILNGEISGFGVVCPDDFHPLGRNVYRDDGTIEVYPIDSSGIERKWVLSRQSVENHRSELFTKKDNKSGEWDIKRKKTKFNFKTVWTDKLYSANSWGSKLLNDILGTNVFTFPKSINTVRDCIDAALNCKSSGIVLDYFAGSGTTGHAIIDLNRRDGGQRKYILVEMGEHFDTVTLPRIKKIIYAPDWKRGKPKLHRDQGVSQLIKCIRLESYDDTLEGLNFTSYQNDIFSVGESALAEDYQLRYALEAETNDSPCLLGKDFTDPFAYRLPVVRNESCCETMVDLPETFNFLLGLHVESRRRIDDVIAITGKDPQGQNCLVLWRNLTVTDNTKLENWFECNRSRFSELLNLIYVNGDQTLNAIRKHDEIWTAETIEPLFRKLMFNANS